MDEAIRPLTVIVPLHWRPTEGHELDPSPQPCYAAAMSDTVSRPLLIAVLNGPDIHMPGSRQPNISAGRRLECEVSPRRPVRVIWSRGWLPPNQQRRRVNILASGGSGTRCRRRDLSNRLPLRVIALVAMERSMNHLDLPNSRRREEIRRHSHVIETTIGVIRGFGVHGDAVVLRAMTDLLEERA